jgi:hypothetical protein
LGVRDIFPLQARLTRSAPLTPALSLDGEVE